MAAKSKLGAAEFVVEGVGLVVDVMLGVGELVREGLGVGLGVALGDGVFEGVLDGVRDAVEVVLGVTDGEGAVTKLKVGEVPV
jgi:hypothetical protein